ncbi:MAG: RluA family pseudouridine synthase [Marinilabilia sp.]
MPLHTHIIPSIISSARLSNYGAGIFPGLPTRSAFKKAIKRGEIFVDGNPGTTGLMVNPAQRITWQEPEKLPGRIFHIHLKVVYEDDHLAVVNKPAGVVVSGNQFRTLENALPAHLSPSSLPDALPAPKAVHRLDAPTSGLIIIAKTSAARVALSRQMENKEIQKSYHVVVIGNTPSSMEINDPIEDQPALTTFGKVQTVPSLRSGHLTLLKAKPVTGRTHQIRKHLSSAGFPILGDKLYGKEGLIMRGKGLFLCATEIIFNHPHTEEKLHLQIEMPAKFEKFMEGEKKRFFKAE